MTIKESLRSNFPNTFDKSSPVFTALIANDKGTAVLEKVLTELRDYMKVWKTTDDIYTQKDEILTKTASLYTYLTKFTNESDESYKNRIKALFVRNNDFVWGTPYNIKNVFKQYFSSASIYLQENIDSDENNLIQDFEFEDENESGDEEWDLNNASIEKEARFTNAYGVLFEENGTCSQSVEITAGKVHHLHFFHKGKIKVQIKDNNNKYWTGTEWTAENKSVLFNNDDWEDSCLFINADETTNLITVTFIGASGAYLDYVSLFEYVGYPTFKIIVHNEGLTGKNALALAPGEGPDPNPASYAQNAGYYNNAYMTGASSGFAQDIYDDLLTYIKGSGVKAYLVTVTRDVSVTQ